MRARALFAGPLALCLAGCGGGVVGGGPGGDTGTNHPADGGSHPLDSDIQRTDAPVERRDGGTVFDGSQNLPDARVEKSDAVSHFDAKGASDTGTTGKDSSSPIDATPACDGPLCCKAGFHVCGTTCADDTSPATCGSSCTACTAPLNGVASCDGTACSYTCNSGYITCATGCCSCGDTLTDPNNCGACGNSCGGQACVDGICGSTVIATDQSNAYALAADDTYVYWITSGSVYNINETPVGGGGTTVILNGDNVAYPGGFVVSSGDIYWSNEIPSGTIERLLTSGGNSTPLTTGVSYPSTVFASGNTLYFATNTYESATSGAIMSVPLGGGSPTMVADNQEFSMNSGGPSIAVSGSNVYWTTATDIVTAPTTGGNVATFAANQYAGGIVADATNVYWTSELSGGIVVQQSITGGSSITLATSQYSPYAMALDSTTVYWGTAQGGTGTVVKVPIGGGTQVTLAMNQAQPFGIALNSTTVFWIDYGDGSIHSVPK